ncbi:MAG TPA: DUF2127 domain-containing protein [Solirubrobacteraceae bacterium]
MNLVPRKWHLEGLVCGLRGHSVPAAGVRELRPQDGGLAVDLPDGRRLARCTRCDVWHEVTAPPAASAPVDLGDLHALPVPRRGEELREALVMRLIAIDKVIHSLLFALAAIALGIIELKLGGLHNFANRLLRSLNSSTTQPSSSSVTHWLHRLAGLRRSHLQPLLLGAVAYAVLEGIEAWGLWRERTWAEYLTVIATSALIPLEIYELTVRVTPLKIAGLVVNVGIVVWLVWAKRLFGVRGGRRGHERPDPALLFAAPRPTG